MVSFVIPLNELIDTLWNVNFFFLSISISVAAELIDTLRNVNKRTSSKNRRLYCELIDTLWNVNAKLEELITSLTKN